MIETVIVGLIAGGVGAFWVYRKYPPHQKKEPIPSDVQAQLDELKHKVSAVMAHTGADMFFQNIKQGPNSGI